MRFALVKGWTCVVVQGGLWVNHIHVAVCGFLPL